MRGNVNAVRQLDLLISSKNSERFRQHISPGQKALRTEGAQREPVYTTNHSGSRNCGSGWRNGGQEGGITNSSLQKQSKDRATTLKSGDFDLSNASCHL